MNTDTTTLALPTDLLPTSENLCGVSTSAVQPPDSGSVQPPQTSNGSPQRNVLKFNDRKNLSFWLDQPENREYAAKESDTDTAIRATNALKFLITAPNITSMRRELGIQKLKPEPPIVPPAADLDLIALHKKLEDQGLEIKSLRADVTTLNNVIPKLREALNAALSQIGLAPVEA